MPSLYGTDNRTVLTAISRLSTPQFSFTVANLQMQRLAGMGVKGLRESKVYHCVTQWLISSSVNELSLSVLANLQGFAVAWQNALHIDRSTQ